MSSASASATTRPVLRAAAASCVVLFALAFVAAPYSCEGGLTAYFWSGVACMVAMFTLPFWLDRAASIERRIVWAFSLAGVVLLTWIGGLFAANVRIMCRLF